MGRNEGETALPPWPPLPEIYGWAHAQGTGHATELAWDMGASAK